MKLSIEDVAKLCHGVNAEYCYIIGDLSQPTWDDAPEWQKVSAIKGVKFHLENSDAGPSASHESWLKEKEADGWKYGEVKDLEKKEHPCFIEYSKLPVEQKVKDSLFISTINAVKILF